MIWLFGIGFGICLALMVEGIICKTKISGFIILTALAGFTYLAYNIIKITKQERKATDEASITKRYPR